MEEDLRKEPEVLLMVGITTSKLYAVSKELRGSVTRGLLQNVVTLQAGKWVLLDPFGFLPAPQTPLGTATSRL